MAQSTTATSIHKSPVPNRSAVNELKLPREINAIAPTNESMIPKSCARDTRSPSTDHEITTIRNGVSESSSNALNALVVVSARYTHVWKEAMPVDTRATISFQWRRISDRCRLSRPYVSGSNIARAIVHLQKFSDNGEIALRSARPTMKFPDQNSAAALSPIIGEVTTSQAIEPADLRSPMIDPPCFGHADIVRGAALVRPTLRRTGRRCRSCV